MMKNHKHSFAGTVVTESEKRLLKEFFLRWGRYRSFGRKKDSKRMSDER